MIANTPERVAAIKAHAQRIRDVNFVVNNVPEWGKWCEGAVDEQVRAARAAVVAAPR